MPQASFPSEFPTLQGKAVCLRELCEDDIPGWFARATDAEAADLAGDPVPESIDMGTLWLERQRRLFRDRTGIRWAIAPVGSSVSVGTVGLTLDQALDGIAELGIVLARAHWSKGLGTTSARMAVLYGFEVLALREIRAEVLQRNSASIRLLEKTGFRMVRVLPPTEAEPEIMLAFSFPWSAPSAA